MHLQLKIVLITVAVIAASACANAQSGSGSGSGSVADKKFWTLTAWNAITTSTDAYTTVDRIGPNRVCTHEADNPRLYGSHPHPLRVTAVMGGMFVTSALLSYELKKHHVRLWRVQLWSVPEGYIAYGHAQGTIHNLKVCR